MPDAVAETSHLSIVSGEESNTSPFENNILDSLAHPVCLFDEMLCVHFLNRSWARYTSSKYTNSLEDKFDFSNFLHQDDRLALIERLKVAFLEGGPMTCECRLVDADSHSKWFLLSIQLHAGYFESRRLWLCDATDIDRLKEQEIELRRLSSMQTEMLNVSVDCIKLISPEGKLLHMNEAGCKALGVSPDSGFGMKWLPLLPEDVWKNGQDALGSASNGQMGRFPGRSELPGEKPQHWDNMLTPVFDAYGQVQAILCVSREVTAEREAQEALRQSQERLAIATRVGHLGIWDYDFTKDLLECDEQWHRIMGQTGRITSLNAFRSLLHPDDAELVINLENFVSDDLSAHEDQDLTFRVLRSDGDIRSVRSVARLIRDRSGHVVRAVGFVVDMTDSLRSELALKDANAMLAEETKILARLSFEDPLTGLANRRALQGKLSEILQERQAVTLLMIDVDYFKRFNDRYGHLEGDRVLYKVAETFRSVSRSSDFIARYGGEEFVFVLPETDDPQPFLARLFQAVEGLAIVHQNSPFKRVTISCGGVIFQDAAIDDADQCLKLCDEALYDAKARGRNGSVIHTFNRPS